MSQDFKDWKELLERCLSPAEKRQLAKDIEVSSMTLSRWITGESKPRIANLRLLLKAPQLYPYHDTLLDLLEQAFPGENFQEVPLASAISGIPAEVYAEILGNLRMLAPELRTWSLCELLLDRLLRHLDPENEGMLLLIVQCRAVPQEGATERQVTRLQEIMSSSYRLTRRSPLGVFRGIETVAGKAVMEGVSILSQENLSVLHDAHTYKSVSVFPLQRGSRIAGALIVQSLRTNYITSERKSLLEKYTDLLALAFPDEDFFPRHAIALTHAFPSETQQQVLHLYLKWTLNEYVHAAHPSARLEEAEARVQEVMNEYAERSVGYDSGE